MALLPTYLSDSLIVAFTSLKNRRGAVLAVGSPASHGGFRFCPCAALAGGGRRRGRAIVRPSSASALTRCPQSATWSGSLRRFRGPRRFGSAARRSARGPMPRSAAELRESEARL